MNDIFSLTIHGIRERLLDKSISSEELTRSLVDRIHNLNGQLSAFIHVNENAVEDARAIDAQRRQGLAVGPLAGIPIAVKDLIDTDDELTSYGGRHYVNFTPNESASVVKRLKQAGAVIVGKTNLHEYAYGVTTENPHFGASRNPWKTERITGGSSGGNSTALMAGMAYGTVGTDTGGSIRIPAALCGHVGLKPTYGRVSRHGVFPLAMTLDHIGPMTKSVSDAALMLEIMAGYDPLDPSTEQVPLRTFLDTQYSQEIRIGVPKNFFYDSCQVEVLRTVQGALLNHPIDSMRIIEVEIPLMDDLPRMQNTIIASEARFIHETHFKNEGHLYGSDVHERLRLAEEIRGYDYVKALNYREEFIRAINQLFMDVDVIVTPTTPITATLIGARNVMVGQDEVAVRPQLTRYTNPWNFGGFPAITIPCGLTSDNLPIGMQLVAGRFSEAKLLSIAEKFEAEFSFPTIAPSYSE